MHIIKPSVVLIEEKDPFKKVEMAARTCYKSEANITNESAKKMFSRLASSKHTAMMEHATFVFEIRGGHLCEDLQMFGNKYLNYTTSSNRKLVSGNVRAINESGISSLLLELRKIDPALVYVDIKDENADGAKIVDFESLENKTKEEIRAHRYTTMRFITDRGVTHEIVRHRPFSFAQESTRYVNYNSQKFGGGDIAFIEPANFNEWKENVKSAFISNLEIAEKSYNQMIELGLTPQQARAVLPNAIKTEIVVTGNDKEWQHFFNLRSRGTTGAPHPDMKVVADMALDVYNNRYND